MGTFYKDIGIDGLSDYCKGIMYASGCIIRAGGMRYLCVRNIDKWYAECVGKETGYTPYPSVHNIERDGRPQWTVKPRNMQEMPDIRSAKNTADFIRPYLELHSTLDTVKAGNARKVRLRIYGKEEFLSIIMYCIPAKPKKNTENKQQNPKRRRRVYRKNMCDLLPIAQRDRANIKLYKRIPEE